MKSRGEIKMLRSSRGYFTLGDMVDALEKEGCELTTRGLALKEKGTSPFTAKEVVALSKILDLSLDEAVSFFV